jgi:hypothetical protein
MSKMIAEASLLSAVFTARRKNVSSEGATSPRNGTTTTSPLWTLSRAWAVAEISRDSAAKTVLALTRMFLPLQRALE